MDDHRSRLASLEPNRSREARPAAIEPFGLELAQSQTQTKPEGPTNFYHTAPIKFREAGQTYEADTLDRRYLRGERVLVETHKGIALAFIAQNSERKFSQQPTIKILRRIEDTDLRQVERNAAKEEEAFRFCLERVKARDLQMKLIRTEVLHGGNKAIFYFSAEGRIDFRELVKDLAHKFHLRIEMRQVGVRDEAKLMGGVGACGRELCCSTWLKDFAPVSLKMARDQNLALNPQKVSGVCGRLMCCLSYEEDSYRELRRGLPRLGRRVITPKGEGEVRELDVLRQRVRVSFDEFQEIFPVSEIKYSSDNNNPNEEETIEENPERSREERRERGRRMLERRGIIGSGEASAAASASPNASPDARSEPTVDAPSSEPRRDSRREERDDRRQDSRGPRDEQRADNRRPREDNRNQRDDRGPRQPRPDDRRDDNRGPREENRSGQQRDEQRGNQRDDNRGNQRRDDRPRPQNERREDSRGPRDENRGPREDNRSSQPRDDQRGNQRDDNRGNQRDDQRGNQRDDRRGPPRHRNDPPKDDK
jgi:cell fate regulator YaaT (PSP1 superfamily)